MRSDGMIKRIGFLMACFVMEAVCAASALPPCMERIEGLVAFWDFQEAAGQPRISRGSDALALIEKKGPVERADGGVFGPYSARIKRGQWLMIKRSDIGPLDIHGTNAQVSVVAWVARRHSGMGPPRDSQISRNLRQYRVKDYAGIGYASKRLR